jgi:hypothetical protein
MGRGNVSQWCHEHHLLPAAPWSGVRGGFVDFLKTSWVIVVLLLLGLMAVVTAALIAWPALSFLGAKLIH